jgi:hypothetical protein
VTQVSLRDLKVAAPFVFQGEGSPAHSEKIDSFVNFGESEKNRILAVKQRLSRVFVCPAVCLHLFFIANFSPNFTDDSGKFIFASVADRQGTQSVKLPRTNAL